MHCGEQPGAAHTWLPLQPPDAQSSLLPHTFPSRQTGAHAGEAHCHAETAPPGTVQKSVYAPGEQHTSVAQSSFAPHGSPWPQAGAHDGCTQRCVDVSQFADAQSPFWPQGFWSGHEGAHVGGAQVSSA